MSSHLEEWTDHLVVRLDDMVGGLSEQQLDEVARSILETLQYWGDELLAHLDPPIGLRRWLSSHGLSLVPTHEPVKPRAWNEMEESEHTEIQSEKAQVIAHVHDRLYFRTAPTGPRAESLLGSGMVQMVRRAKEDGEKLIYTVRLDGGDRLVHLCPANGDEIWDVRGWEETAI